MKWIAGLLAAVVLMMPLGFAQANAQGEANTQAVSAFGLKLGQIGEAFGDFVFHVKSVLTFDEKAKIDLLKERNTEMKMRQQAWLETKAEALAAFESGDLSATEKQDILATIQAEHEAIIKEHLRLTGEIKKLQLKAMASGNADIESKAKAAAEASSRSGLSLGLLLNHKNGFEGEFEADQETEAELSHSLTADEAKQLVTSKLGFEASSVTTEIRNGATVYAVTGAETETAGSFTLVKSFTAIVEPETGLITSVDLSAHIEKNTTASAGAQASASGSAEASGSASGGSSGSADGNAQAGASGSVSGSASGSAGASVGGIGGLNIG